MKTVLVLMTCVWCPVMAHQGWKISKAMKNNLNAKEEHLMEKKELNAEFGEFSAVRNKMENIKAKSVQELHAIFQPGEGKCRNIMEINPSKFQERRCINYDPRWVFFFISLAAFEFKVLGLSWI